MNCVHYGYHAPESSFYFPTVLRFCNVKDEFCTYVVNGNMKESVFPPFWYRSYIWRNSAKMGTGGWPSLVPKLIFAGFLVVDDIFQKERKRIFSVLPFKTSVSIFLASNLVNSSPKKFRDEVFRLLLRPAYISAPENVEASYLWLW